MPNSIKLAKTVFFSAGFSLFTCLVVAAIGASGVISMGVTHALFMIATLFAVFAIITSVIIYKKSALTIVAIGLLTFLLVGGGLYVLDRWLTHQREQLNSLVTPPQPKPPSVPPIAFVKWPYPQVVASGKNSVAISNSKIQQHSEGPNSPNVIGSGNQFNFAPATRAALFDRAARGLKDKLLGHHA